ncbi:MAG: hypothetical protein IH905_05945 [Proteobacteria bacterium]|nr:hypothetical protein [Pseudomonadota bacterium]
MKSNTPGPVSTGSEGEEIEAADPLRILRLAQNCNLARLGYLGRLADRQAREAERFDEMRLAAERYRTNPTPTNAVKAHLAARRYEAAA